MQLIHLLKGILCWAFAMFGCGQKWMWPLWAEPAAWLGGVATYLGDLSEPFVISQKVADFPEDTLLRIYVGICCCFQRHLQIEFFITWDLKSIFYRFFFFLKMTKKNLMCVAVRSRGWITQRVPLWSWAAEGKGAERRKVARRSRVEAEPHARSLARPPACLLMASLREAAWERRFFSGRRWEDRRGDEELLFGSSLANAESHQSPRSSVAASVWNRVRLTGRLPVGLHTHGHTHTHARTTLVIRAFNQWTAERNKTETRSDALQLPAFLLCFFFFSLSILQIKARTFSRTCTLPDISADRNVKQVVFFNSLFSFSTCKSAAVNGLGSLFWLNGLNGLFRLCLFTQCQI